MKTTPLILNFFLNWFTAMGEFTLFFFRVLRGVFSFKFSFSRTLEQMVFLGVNSLNITMVTAMFVGMSFSFQVVKEFVRFGAGGLIGGILAMALWRELVPMMTGAVIAGRVGAAISAELGTMKVTEQVDALKSLSQNVVLYLVCPRVVALTVMLPLLIAVADVVGYFSGFLIAYFVGGINPASFFNSTQNLVGVMDVTGGLIKGAFFGLAISMLSAFRGLQTTSGAKGVGKSTRRGVVASLIAIFVLNYFLSMVIFS